MEGELKRGKEVSVGQCSRRRKRREGAVHEVDTGREREREGPRFGTDVPIEKSAGWSVRWTISVYIVIGERLGNELTGAFAGLTSPAKAPRARAGALVRLTVNTSFTA